MKEIEHLKELNTRKVQHQEGSTLEDSTLERFNSSKISNNKHKRQYKNSNLQHKQPQKDIKRIENIKYF